MNSSNEIESRLSKLADHARGLLSATSDVAEDHVKEARARLLSALDNGKTYTNRLREQASDRTREYDEALHENPYLAIGIAAGVGALLCYLTLSGCSRTSRRN